MSNVNKVDVEHTPASMVGFFLPVIGGKIKHKAKAAQWHLMLQNVRVTPCASREKEASSCAIRGLDRLGSAAEAQKAGALLRRQERTDHTDDEDEDDEDDSPSDGFL